MKLADFKQRVESLGLSDEKIRGSAFIHRLLPVHAYWSPIAFTVSITTHCNLKCPMCIRTINNIKPMHMDVGLFVHAIKYFKGKTVNIVGSGEPLMHPDFFDFMNVCLANDVGVHLVTNGMLLDGRKAEQLASYSNLQSVAFFIDSVQENYKDIRVGGDFETVYKNLVGLDIARIKNNSKFSIVVNTVGMRSNIEGFPKLVDWLGITVDSIQLIHPLAYTPEMAQEHLDRDPLGAKSIFKESIEIAKSRNVKLKLPSLIPRARGCIYPWVLPVVGVKGDVYPCHMYGGGDQCSPIREYYGKASMVCDASKMVMGNIVDFDKIWNGEVIRKLRGWLSSVNVFDLKHGYCGNSEYEEQINLRGSYFYCAVCPSRWDCAC